MEHPIYCYQSTFYNYIPFVVGYEHLASNFSDSVHILQEFNSMFKNSLMNIVKHSVHVDIPTLKNLYEEVMFLMKDTLTKTNYIQSIFSKASEEMDSNCSKLRSVHEEHLDHLVQNSKIFDQIRSQLKTFKQSADGLNQEILVITQADTIQQYYKQIYKEKYTLNGRKIARLENQLGMVNAKVQCLEENLEVEFQKNRRLFSVLSNELEEVMFSAPRESLSNLKGKSFPNHPDKISPSLEQECIQVEQQSIESGDEFQELVDQQKRQIEQLMGKMELH